MANNLEKWMIIAFVGMLFSSCTRYQMTSTQVLDDLGVKYVMVEGLEGHKKADAEYNFEEDTIYFKKYSKYVMWHELVHKLRSDAGIFGDKYLEEVIAVKAAYHLGKISRIGSGMAKWEIPGVLSRTVRANGFKPRRLSDEEREYVKEQIKVTEQLLRDRLKAQGYSLDSVDWVKTAVFILL